MYYNIFFIWGYLFITGGLLYTPEELEKLSVVFRKYNILVISDEIYSYLTYPGSSFTSLAKVYPIESLFDFHFSRKTL